MIEPTEAANTFHAIVEERRTIRAFLPDPVPQEVLDRCLDSALRAASSSNLQPWEFVIIKNPEIRKQANAICFNQRGPETAPMLIAVVAHRETWKRHCRFILDTLKERGILRKSQEQYWGRLMPLIYIQGPFGILGCLKKTISRVVSLFRPMHNMLSLADLRVMTHKSTALGAATFMLALRAEGFDSCPMEGFDPWRAKKLLGLPRGAEVCMFLAVGKRSETGLWWERMLVPRAWAVREI
ncbi:MAG: nitroreductase family protein [Holophaga sp.]|nr:nitroreductase family protein [Holophaga sp.]